MPAVPVSPFEPVWEQFAALLPERPAVAPTHPLGCHRRRVPDRVVFGHVVAALVHGSGYERVASPGCSDRTIRRRVREWAEAGLAEEVHALALAQYDRLVGLELADLCVDGCVTKAPGGGEAAGRSPVDRGKRGLKRSVVTDAAGVPLHLVAAGANRHDAPLLGPLPAGVTVHLDRGYAGAPTRELLAGLGFAGAVSPAGLPVRAGPRWVVERTHAWLNGFGKLRRCTERRAAAVGFYLFLAAAFVVVRMLIDEARSRYRWPDRPTARRLR